MSKWNSLFKKIIDFVIKLVCPSCSVPTPIPCDIAEQDCCSVVDDSIASKIFTDVGKAKKYASDNGYILLVVCGHSGCGFCQKFYKSVLMTKELVDYADKAGIVLCKLDGGQAAATKVWSDWHKIAKIEETTYPFIFMFFVKEGANFNSSSLDNSQVELAWAGEALKEKIYAGWQWPDGGKVLGMNVSSCSKWNPRELIDVIDMFIAETIADDIEKETKEDK